MDSLPASHVGAGNPTLNAPVYVQPLANDHASRRWSEISPCSEPSPPGCNYMMNNAIHAVCYRQLNDTATTAYSEKTWTLRDAFGRRNKSALA